MLLHQRSAASLLLYLLPDLAEIIIIKLKVVLVSSSLFLVMLPIKSKRLPSVLRLTPLDSVASSNALVKLAENEAVAAMASHQHLTEEVSSKLSKSTPLNQMMHLFPSLS